MTLDDAYKQLANHGSSSAELGGMLITTLEPGPGAEAEYMRWYEDDHYISGAMVWPWVFAGRRWISTRDLKAFRAPERSSLISPEVRTSYFNTYLISDGHVGDVEDFAQHSLERLQAEDRMKWEMPRTHVYTNFEDFVGAAYADGVEARAVHALDHPFASTALEVIDAPDTGHRDELTRWVLEEHAPEVMSRLHGPQMCIVMTPRPRKLKGDGVKSLAAVADDHERRATVVWFSTSDPADLAASAFPDEEAAVAASGKGALQLFQPFRPAIHGTNTYADEL